ncbi:nicotinate-nucleotide adenylyltransferase [Candidatus Liberibacter africanus]|uniref:Probable nicotinate-nucleotide adenylyltransferase n=1 Tax=Candidatus Liberibacter africanus PTSAPSY TaxID=1277257 RepID=A0A0G3I4T0_LIBAF|nr:nicotinate-nucleotide adenylyltransferase [Candidatus Liberibacter africanus]AKK20265.1 nicotinic acid mononucleotide adenylyltransferase [Candidatus Liberibacter africanus PTSAPSY]QTP64028.1 nicotinate-nucleotide adenylyltransferase [Candidatus Liberibacter africanus]
MQQSKHLQDIMRMPKVESGMNIGLFGGNFNPPHYGHIEIANIALKKLNLDQLWWIITPYNPIKHYNIPSSLEKRIALSKSLIKNPRIRITAFEESFNQKETFHTILEVKKHNKHVNFIWIMGADNIKSFHHWHHWKKIVMTVPVAIIDRLDVTFNYISSPMAKTFEHARLDESLSHRLCNTPPPSWIFIHDKHHIISSTDIRKKKIEQNTNI